MKHNIEYVNYPESERLSMLETRAAELERMLGEDKVGRRETDYRIAVHDAYDPVAVADSGVSYGVPDAAFGGPAGGFAGGGPDGRAESLISRGRVNARRGRLAVVREHWKAAAAAAGAVVVLVIVVAAAWPGAPAAAWPAVVTRMQAQVAAACANPDVAAEPTQVDFACARGSRAVLWVFALLTSGGNPGYADPVTGRRGLEPITPAQGGDVAWSLNLHRPYDPGRAGDSIEVAARAVNNIVAGATLTGAGGQPAVQDGLEASAANCARYTGSGDLLARAGFPPVCARPLTASGSRALVTDVFRRWMTGAPAQTAADAGVLFASAGDPGGARVREILARLPGPGR